MYACCMCCNAVLTALRMGPIFKGMLMRGNKVVNLMVERLAA